MLLLSAWAAANPSTTFPHVGGGLVFEMPDSSSGEDEDSEDDSDENPDDSVDSSDGGAVDEEGLPAAALIAEGLPTGDDERHLAPAVILRHRPNLYRDHLAHCVRVSHLSPSYLHSIVPNTPWFTVRVRGNRKGGPIDSMFIAAI